MEAFVVFTREETSDPHALATYSAGVGPSFDGHDVTFLAAYGAIQHLEGPPIEGAVILRFPTMQAARDWYLLAAGLGLLVAPMLAFTLASALR